MDKLVSHIEAGNVGKWIKDAGILGEFETEDMDYVVETLREIVANLRKMSPLYEDFIKKAEGK